MHVLLFLLADLGEAQQVVQVPSVQDALSLVQFHRPIHLAPLISGFDRCKRVVLEVSDLLFLLLVELLAIVPNAISRSHGALRLGMRHGSACRDSIAAGNRVRGLSIAIHFHGGVSLEADTHSWIASVLSLED
jgi:hypothetical protein